MAILKHIAVKNADYGVAQRYLIFKHDEKTGKPVLDENGNLQFRDGYILDGINCDAFTFDTECMELNAHRSLAWNMPENIFPNTRCSFAPTRTGITVAGTSTRIL